MTVRLHDQYLATCSCGWISEVRYSSVAVCGLARGHVRRSRRPGHHAYAFNVSKLAYLADYVKSQLSGTNPLF